MLRPKRRSARPQLELLEDRIVLSWGATPPSSIAVPPAGMAVIVLNGLGDASGSASIAGTEVDYYSFVVPKSGIYHIAATTPTSTLDTVLAAYSELGNRLAYNNDVTPGTNTDSALDVKLTAGQKAYVGITNLTGTPGGL